MLVWQNTTGSFAGQPFIETQEMLAGAANVGETSYFVARLGFENVCESQVLTAKDYVN